MKHIFTVSTSVAAGVGMALGAVVLSAGGSTQPHEPARQDNQVVREAPQYVGDPWEKRFRDQFWAKQHIHDSWNRCHLGENVTPALLRFSGC